MWDKVPFSRIAAIFAPSPFSLDAMLDDSSASLSLRTTLHGGRGRKVGRLFPCEKLIDGRGSAFCKLVPHNFGQDCLNVEIKHKSACNFQIIQSMDVKFGMVNVRDLLLVFHPHVAI